MPDEDAWVGRCLPSKGLSSGHVGRGKWVSWVAAPLTKTLSTPWCRCHRDRPGHLQLPRSVLDAEMCRGGDGTGRGGLIPVCEPLERRLFPSHIQGILQLHCNQNWPVPSLGRLSR